MAEATLYFDDALLEQISVQQVLPGAITAVMGDIGGDAEGLHVLTVLAGVPIGLSVVGDDVHGVGDDDVALEFHGCSFR